MKKPAFTGITLAALSPMRPGKPLPANAKPPPKPAPKAKAKPGKRRK